MRIIEDSEAIARPTNRLSAFISRADLHSFRERSLQRSRRLVKRCVPLQESIGPWYIPTSARLCPLLSVNEKIQYSQHKARARTKEYVQE
jgi:hypothetical protein